jgi:hypothetical protein
MKIVIAFMGLATALFLAGCEEQEHEHDHEGVGGAYDGSYQDYGHSPYPGDPYYYRHD